MEGVDDSMDPYNRMDQSPVGVSDKKHDFVGGVFHGASGILGPLIRNEFPIGKAQIEILFPRSKPFWWLADKVLHFLRREPKAAVHPFSTEERAVFLIHQTLRPLGKRHLEHLLEALFVRGLFRPASGET
jgi:hypothetical protein